MRFWSVSGHFEGPWAEKGPWAFEVKTQFLALRLYSPVPGVSSHKTVAFRAAQEPAVPLRDEPSVRKTDGVEPRLVIFVNIDKRL